MKYKGVTRRKKGKKLWSARLTINKRTHEGGVYATAEQAAAAYNELVHIFFKDFLNKDERGVPLKLEELEACEVDVSSKMTAGDIAAENERRQRNSLCEKT